MNISLAIIYSIRLTLKSTGVIEGLNSDSIAGTASVSPSRDCDALNPFSHSERPCGVLNMYPAVLYAASCHI